MLELIESKRIMRFQNKIPDLYGRSNCEVVPTSKVVNGSILSYFGGRRLQLGASLAVAHSPSGVYLLTAGCFV